MACDAGIDPMSAGVGTELDLVLFNHEPQWYLLDEFRHARRRVFYALHYSRLYEKEASWESLRVPVDLQIANSNWTADRIEAEIGSRPVVQLGGVNRDGVPAVRGAEAVSTCCARVLGKAWKGTDTIMAAGQRLGVDVRGYGDKDLDQPALGREYDAARVFAVGSWFEGFCQPGLEALACGVPLVTTDNGGCLEYAIDGETALVVPPRDAPAMAQAIGRLLDEPELAGRLRENGLAMVEESFDWERRADEFADVLDGVVAGRTSAPPPPRPAPPDDPELTVVVLAWDNLLYTQRFVETVRQRTDVDYELVIVDNGSAWEAASYAAAAADHAVMNDTNLGFSKGMNQGLDVARGAWVAFCNNDTLMPEGWASMLLETARAHPQAGIVVPALTAARNPATVRTEPGVEVEVLAPFSAPPAAVVFLMRTDVVRELGAWEEEYEVASAEDVDLCFKVWVNDLDIVYDQRVLVDHIGKGSASRLDDWIGLWARNRALFLEKWSGDREVPRLERCDPERHARNRRTASAVANWMAQYFAARDQAAARRSVTGAARSTSAGVRSLRSKLVRRARPVWRRVSPHLPPEVRRVLRSAARRLR